MRLEKKYETPFPASVVYQAWLSPDTVVPPVTRIEVNPSVGGYLVLHVDGPAGRSIMRGVFLKIIPDECLRYSWHWEGTDETTVVGVGFESRSGASALTIRQNGFRTRESMDRHAAGWDAYVAGLLTLIGAHQH